MSKEPLTTLLTLKQAIANRIVRDILLFKEQSVYEENTPYDISDAYFDGTIKGYKEVIEMIDKELNK